MGTQSSLVDDIRQVQEPGNKFAMEVDDYLMLELAQKRSEMVVKKLKDWSRGEHVVLYFPAHHRFYNVFGKKIKQMSEAGLFNLYIREVTEMYRRKTPHQFVEPFQVLKLEELEAGFVICTAPMLIAIVVFCFEWAVALKNLIVSLCIFRALFALKEIEMNASKSYKEMSLIASLSERRKRIQLTYLMKLYPA